MAAKSEDLVKQLEEYLCNSNIDKVLELSDDPQFEQCYLESYWDLIPIVSTYLNSETLNKNENLFRCCEELMNKIADKSPPEESLLLFIEQIESLNDTRFTTLLKPLQTIVLKTMSKLRSSFEWCCNSIHRHLQSLPVPEDEDLESEERKLMDCDPKVQRIADLCSTVLSFYDPFIVILHNEDSNLNSKNKENLKDAILCSCFRHFCRPLLYMDLEYDGKTKSSVRHSSEKIIDIIYNVQPNLYFVLLYFDLSDILRDLRKSKDEYKDSNSVSDIFLVEDKFSPVSLGIYCYLIFGEGIKLKELPQVLNPLFILSRNLYLSVLLLNAPKSLIQRKGLLLVKGTLDRFFDFSLPHEELDSPFYRYLIEGFYVVAVYSYLKDNRQLAIKLVKNLLFKFDLIGRYILLTKMVKLANHSGIIGYLATLYKDVILDVLNKSPEDTTYFTEKRILSLLDLFCDLPFKEQSDLIELSDKIISSLNLVRYIVIRDKNNRTGISGHMKHLQKNFLDPLQEGINLSRAHYKLKLKDVEEESRKRKSKSSGVPIYIGKEQVPNLPPNEKIVIINSALNVFDVMEHLLCEVNGHLRCKST